MRVIRSKMYQRIKVFLRFKKLFAFTIISLFYYYFSIIVNVSILPLLVVKVKMVLTILYTVGWFNLEQHVTFYQLTVYFFSVKVLVCKVTEAVK